MNSYALFSPGRHAHLLNTPEWIVRIRKCRHAACISLLLGLINQPLPTHAAPIFADDFSRANSNDPGNGWLSLEKDANDVAVYRDTLRLRDTRDELPSAALYRSVDISDFSAFSLSFDWRATTSTEPSDELYAGFRNESGDFEALWNTALGGSDFVTETFALDLPADDMQTLDLAFWIEVGSANETVYLDNILLSGVPRTNAENDNTETLATVDEPASLSLILAGLAGLCHSRVRKQGKAPITRQKKE